MVQVPRAQEVFIGQTAEVKATKTSKYYALPQMVILQNYIPQAAAGREAFL
jgi:hypothetical protein